MEIGNCFLSFSALQSILSGLSSFTWHVMKEPELCYSVAWHRGTLYETSLDLLPSFFFVAEGKVHFFFSSFFFFGFEMWASNLDKLFQKQS